MRKCIILFIVLLEACASSKNVVGTYASNQSPYQFTIKSDSSFTYQYKFQFAYQYSNGKWKNVGKNKIELQSQFKNKAIPITVKEYTNEHANDSVQLNIESNILSNERKYYQCLIFIDNTFFTQKNCDALSSLIVPTPKRNMYFKLTADARMPARFLDTLTSSTYTLKNKNPYRIDINMSYNDSLFNYKLFNNEVLLINNGKLKYGTLKLPKVKN